MLRLNRRSRQETTVRPLRVLVAAPQPLHRELVRFFLEEAGCHVVALVASGGDAVSLVTSKRPDAVILHESLVTTVGAGLIQRVRQGSTSTKVVVVTPQPERAWSGRSRGADAFVEEWVGIQELGVVLQRLCRGSPPVQPARVQAKRATVGSSPAAGQGEGLPPPPRAVHLPMGVQARWYERLRGAAAASVILILLLLGRGLMPPATSEGPGSAASAYLTNAQSTLQLLVASMRAGRPAEAIAETARLLIAERAAALASGADTTRLDAAIDTKVSPLLSDVTDRGAAAIEYVLGDLLSSQGPPAQPRAWPGQGAESRAHHNGKVPPQAVDHPGRNVDRPSVPKPGAQPHADAEPGAQPHADAEPGAQPRADAEPEAGPSGNAEPSETPSSDSPTPIGTTSPSESRGPTWTARPSESRGLTGTASPDVSPSESRAQPNRPALPESQSANSNEFESEAALSPVG
jgi:CheY-like chemotaxis protein